MHDIERQAKKIAEAAHLGVFRKWGERVPYIKHCERIVSKLNSLPETDEIDCAAAWLHDVIEDVAIPRNSVEEFNYRIEMACGKNVLELVHELTNPSAYMDIKCPREQKKAADFPHISKASRRAKRIKLADRLDNIKDSAYAPLKFLKKYIPESKQLLSLIKDAHKELANELAYEIENLERSIWM